MPKLPRSRPSRKRDYEQENAARRLRRQAESMERKAAQAKTPGAASMYQMRAEQLRGQIKETYKSVPQAQRQRAIEKSRAPRTNVARRQRLGESLLRNPGVSRRFFGTTKDIWARPENMVDGKYDAVNIMNSILDFFGAQDVLEVMERLNEAGINIFDFEEGDERYTETIIQGAVFVQSIGAAR